jgi:hypothetical protein
MSQKHSTTAKPLALELVKGLTFSLTALQLLKVLVPQVSDDLAASEASNRDDHLKRGNGKISACM